MSSPESRETLANIFLGSELIKKLLPSFFPKEQEPENVIGTWKKHKYAKVESSFNREQVEKLISLFGKFRKLPEDLKKAICIPGENGRGKGTLGYVERNPEDKTMSVKMGQSPEHKVYFHYNERVLDLLRQEIEQAGPVAVEFIQELHQFWEQVLEDAKKIIIKIQNENPEYGNIYDRFFPENKIPQLVLRILTYKQVRDSQMSANGHRDGGSVTISIMESAPGLYIGEPPQKNSDGQIIKVEQKTFLNREDGEILFWPGATFKSIDPNIKGTWHGVEQKNKVKRLGDDTRYAVVAFLDLYDEKIPSVEETRGWN